MFWFYAATFAIPAHVFRRYWVPDQVAVSIGLTGSGSMRVGGQANSGLTAAWARTESGWDAGVSAFFEPAFVLSTTRAPNSFAGIVGEISTARPTELADRRFHARRWPGDDNDDWKCGLGKHGDGERAGVGACRKMMNTVNFFLRCIIEKLKMSRSSLARAAKAIAMAFNYSIEIIELGERLKIGAIPHKNQFWIYSDLAGSNGFSHDCAPADLAYFFEKIQNFLDSEMTSIQLEIGDRSFVFYVETNPEKMKRIFILLRNDFPDISETEFKAIRVKSSNWLFADFYGVTARELLVRAVEKYRDRVKVWGENNGV